MDETFIINLRVADTRYPLRIRRTDEEVFRKAAVDIDYKLSQYKNHFTSDKAHTLQNTDYMAMAAIQAVSELKSAEMKAESLGEGIVKLINELDNYLQQK